jgi:glycosyltransferase involved in cell wall biosynthesis
MKVGIDVFGCNHGRSGIGSYLRSLVATLPADTHLQFELFGPEADRYTYTSSRRDIGYRSMHQFSVNRMLKRISYDVALYPTVSRVIPSTFNVPGVAVVNEVMSSIFKSTQSSVLSSQIRSGLSRVSKIIVSSQYIRKDLLNLAVDPAKIEVVYPGIDHSLFFPRTETDEDALAIQPFAVRRPYLIYASRILGASKKHVELVKAFDGFKAKTGLPHRLVLAGSDGLGYKALLREVAVSEFKNEIFITGHFPDAGLPLLYAYADACIFPASDEGVGLPVIEAMASGVPVACARSGALQELTGSHAVYFDADSVTDIALTIEKVVTDTELRDKLVSSGIVWTKRFSWKQTSEETIAVLKKTAAR